MSESRLAAAPASTEAGGKAVRAHTLIFLHSSFRVSSTWLWSRFRKSDRVVAYCEIFNEDLADISPAKAGSNKPSAWHSKHPAGAGYFLEFLPFIKNDAGVDGFARTMAFERFIPAQGIHGAIGADERDYLDRLIGHAAALGKTPLLSCTRSLGRLRAIKAIFPGFHVLIYRNLFHQWCSYTEQCLGGNTYFFDTIRRTLDENGHDPFLAKLRALFPLGRPEVDDTNYFCCFVLLHIYLYAQVADAADLIVDVSRMAGDEEYRRAIEAHIADASGVAVDLSDVRDEITFSFVALRGHEDVAEQIRVIADAAIASAAAPSGREFAAKVLADLLREWARYDAYAGPLAKAAGSKGLAGQRDALLAERKALLAERDALLAERQRLCSWRYPLIWARSVIKRSFEKLGWSLSGPKP